MSILRISIVVGLLFCVESAECVIAQQVDAEHSTGEGIARVEELRLLANASKAELSRVLKLAEENIVSTADVEEARLAYLYASVRLKFLEQQPAELDVVKDIESIVEVWDGRLKRVQRLAEAQSATDDEIDTVSASLALERARLEFAKIVSIRQRQWVRTTTLRASRAAIDFEVEMAKLRLIQSVRRLQHVVPEVLDNE